MAKVKVFIRALQAEHQKERLTRFRPLGEAAVGEIRRKVKEIFDLAGGRGLLKASGDVYIKPNGIDAKSYCYTRPEVIEAAIRYWFEAAGKKSNNPTKKQVSYLDD